MFEGGIMSKKNYIKILKIAIGSCIAIMIADSLGLKNSTSSGIIMLLSIQDTKKETIFVAMKRFFSFFIALLIAFFIFKSVGYHAVSFGLFLFVFVSICHIFNLEDGIAMCSVLITHFWLEGTMELYFIKNEFLLMVIGVSIAVILNMYMPRNIKTIRYDQYKIEDSMRNIFNEMSLRVVGENKVSENNDNLNNLESLIEDALTRAYEHMNNTLISDMRYYIQYMEMRKAQCAILKRIQYSIGVLTYVPKQAYVIAGFMKTISLSLNEYNNALALLEEEKKIRQSFKEDLLPLSRDEFEVRAVLFHILNDMEYLLFIKKEFSESLTDSQVKSFWLGQ